MSLKIAINGFGRIGRCVARIIDTRDDVELVCVNDTAAREMTKHLLKYDSVHSTFAGDVEILEDDYMQMGSSKVKMFSTRDPKELNFADYGVDVVLECTGAFLTREKAQVFIDSGIKRVVMSAPAKDDTPTFVMGVNEQNYANQAIVSNASCTTNCLGPVAKIIDDAFGIDKGLMTTVHAYTNGQSLVDVKHKDPRRARAAAVNIIPTTTGAAKAIGLVLPQLQGRLHGQSVRVPVPNVSMVDLNVLVKKETSIEEINALFKEKAENELQGILGYDVEKRVSSDFMTSTYSSFVAADLTQVICGNMVKVMSWYDNEWGYSSRLIDMALHVSK
ncbi:type I glyceraldehyde-3-phosphate dehydrogenase [Sulfurospirillum sp. 1612]|uniref:type I glyceraldehyde-3-phosphate dehydrogenase n=1 Tax=Sulfurospirillum sp. 1612 TaxID=3094835 RepID=UPI002F93E527